MDAQQKESLVRVIWEARLPRGEKLLLLCFAENSEFISEGEWRSCIVTSSKLASQTGYARSTVEDYTDSLITKGYLHTHGGMTNREGVDVYFLHENHFPEVA